MSLRCLLARLDISNAGPTLIIHYRRRPNDYPSFMQQFPAHPNVQFPNVQMTPNGYLLVSSNIQISNVQTCVLSAALGLLVAALANLHSCTLLCMDIEGLSIYGTPCELD